MPPKFSTNNIEKTSPPPLTLEEYKKQGEDFVNSHRKLFASFAEDVSIKFKMLDKFQIDYQTGIVQLDSNWFFERGYNKEQILWAVFHELSHFRDFANDKEGLLGSFEYIKGKADVLAKETGMDQNLAYKTYHTLFNCLDDIYVNKVVSRRASYYESNRQGGKHVEELYREKLFKDTDFTKVEQGDGSFTEMPHHLQFAFYLLRKAMLPDQDIVMSAEVKKALDTKIVIDSKEFTVESMIKTFMLPNKFKDTKASVRHDFLKKYIEPIYEGLIQKDINENKDPETNQQNNSNPESGDQNSGGNEGIKDGSKSENSSDENKDKGESGADDVKPNSGEEKQGEQQAEFGNGDSKNEEHKNGEPNGSDSKKENATGSENSAGENKQEKQAQKFKEWSNIHAEFESKSPDQLSEDDIKKFTEHQDVKKEEQKAKELESKKQPQNEKTLQTNLDRDWADSHKIEGRDILRELQSLRQVEESIMPYLNSLTELWQNIIAGNSVAIDYAKDSAHVSGSELNIDSVIDNMGAIYASQSAPRIYDKITTKEAIVQKPEVIRIRLVVDKSGSMDDGIKQKVLAQTLVLILRSLQQFNEMLNLTRGSTGSKLKVETQVLGFSSRLSIIKKLESEVTEDDPTIEILNTLKMSGAENGYTYDNLALNHVINSQDELSKQRIKQGKVLDVLFEITDGGSSNEDSSKEAVNKLDEAGVYANAFQIGKVDESEKRAFNNVWNTEGNKKGLVVGGNIEKLLPAITEALKKYLSGVRI
jgi:hypothetical protein